jgi:hypothetical protein
MPTYHQTLLLGTARVAGAPELPHVVLAEAWAQLDWTATPEVAALDAAAMIASVRGAGTRAGNAGPAPVPAPVEARKPAPAAATALLRRVLFGEMRPLLPEWLEVCARAGCVVPPFFLPSLFREVSRAERAAFVRVAGTRGAWLATHNTEWSWLADPDEAPSLELWETGTPAQRLACLAAQRRIQPAVARGWLEKSWGEETPDFRTAALGAFVVGLSIEDEPLVMRGLGDRRRETRQQAQQLLACLPASGLAQRMQARAAAILGCRRGLLSRQLEVTLPAAFDPAWKADGIEEKPPAGAGEKAFWIRQILALVPVRRWLEEFRVSAGDLVKLAQKSEWSEVLIDAWLRALPLGADPGLAAALFEPVLVLPKQPPVGTQASEVIAQLFAACTDAERWSLAARHGGERFLAWWCVPHLGPAESLSDARAVLRHLLPALRDGTAPGGTPTAVAAARAIPPALRDEAAAWLARDNGLSKPGEHFLQALDLRAAMHAAFGTAP